jgi:hypothetical protein
MIGTPAGAIMTASGEARDPFRKIPANLSRTTGFTHRPRLLHILFGAAFAVPRSYASRSSGYAALLLLDQR